MLPDKYESGTPNTPGLAGLSAAIDFVTSVTAEKIRATISQVGRNIIEGLQEMDAYVRVFHTAAAKLTGERRSSQWDFQKKPLRVLAKPGLAWAAGFALLLLSITWFAGLWRPSRPPDSSPVAVVLQSTRGVDGLVSARAPKGEFLLLQVDLAELPSLPAYGLEIVDGRGSRVWESTGRPDNGGLSVPVSKALKEGRYWVRLYAATPARELLREFGLLVE